MNAVLRQLHTKVTLLPVLLPALLAGACTRDVAGPNRAPVAEAGPDIQVGIGLTASLDWSRSFDPDGDALVDWEWKLIGGPDGARPGALSASDDGHATLTPDLAGTWIVRLRVSDGALWSEPDVVEVRAAGCSTDSDCLDEDLCNGQETCVAGACQPGTALDCSDGIDCTLDECDPATGCQHPAADDDTPCGNQFCSGHDLMSQACQAGACSGTVLIETCDDGNGCTDDACDPVAGCTHSDNTATCDDGDPCSDQDTCSGGACVGGQTNLDADADGFLDGACPGGNDCDDQDSQVNLGAFEGSDGDPACSDGIDNDCDGLTDAADSGCQPCAGDEDCIDQNLCNGDETCAGQRCQPGSPLSCANANPCTIATCDPGLGCRDLIAADGTECGSRSCDGLIWTRQTCLQGDCRSTAVQQNCDDGNVCTADACDDAAGCQPTPEPAGTECGSRSCDGDRWMSQTCQAGACSQTTLFEDCDQGIECVDYACDPSTGCSAVPLADGAACGESFCDGLEWKQKTCQSDACDGEELLADCDGGTVCVDYGCLDQTGCTSSPSADGTECGSRSCDGTQLKRQVCAGGACGGSELVEDCNDANDCTDDDCDPSTGCSNQINPGAACTPDTFSCTEDKCDDQGACTHVEQDGACAQMGDLCRPTCFAPPTGCGTPPTSASLTCEDPIVLSDTDASNCTFTLTGGDNINQDACVACSAEVGVVVLDHTDFDDSSSPGSCSLDGWTLLGAGSCFGDSDQCPMASWGSQDCCQDNYCPISIGSLDEQIAFEANKARCGAGQWHLRKPFDTSGVYDLELCFDYADHQADNNDILQVMVTDLDNNSLLLDCDNFGPRTGVDDTWYRFCYSLPAFAENNPDVFIHFYAFSHDNNEAIFLDNITLKGLSLACPASYEDIFHEDFSGCANALADWNDWSVSNFNNTLSCQTGFNCYDGSKRVKADSSNGQFSRTLDLHEYHDVDLCFWMGDNNAGPGEAFRAEVDPTGTGSGWVTAWGRDRDAGGNNTCVQVCVNLSDEIPAVDRNPNVLLRFTMTSDGGELDLDEVLVRGARACDGAGVVGVSWGGLAGGPGQYPFDATDLAGTQLPARMTCSWDSPPAGQEVEASGQIRFQP